MGVIFVVVFFVVVVNDLLLFDIILKWLYFYSKEDDIIYWEDIERYVVDVKSKGWDVLVEIFEGICYVGYMKVYLDKYWIVISVVWKDVVKKWDY